MCNADCLVYTNTVRRTYDENRKFRASLESAICGIEKAVDDIDYGTRDIDVLTGKPVNQQLIECLNEIAEKLRTIEESVGYNNYGVYKPK